MLVHAEISAEEEHFKLLLQGLLQRFRGDKGSALLQSRGALIVRGLCSLLGGVRVFRELACILEGEECLSFASMLVQVRVDTLSCAGSHPLLALRAPDWCTSKQQASRL